MPKCSQETVTQESYIQQSYLSKKGKMKIFPDTQKLRECVSFSLNLQEISEGTVIAKSEWLSEGNPNLHTHNQKAPEQVIT